MPTDAHDDTEGRLRDRFQILGRHLEETLDDPTPMLAPLPSRTRRAPGRRSALVAAALILVGGAGLWMATQDSSGPAVVSTMGSQPATSGPTATTDPAFWPPLAEVHEHCIEDDETRALHADGDYPSEAVRTQHCELGYHDDLLKRVGTPDDVGPGAITSAALRDLSASNEFEAALAANGMDGNDVGTQQRAAGLWRAFQSRHAVPVVDQAGRQIGWFGDGFVTMEDMPAVRQDAEQAIAEFERNGTLPPS